MDVMIMAIKGCSHCKHFSRELDAIEVVHSIVYCEDDPELVKKYGIKHLPNLIVNGEVVFRRPPTEKELKEYFICK